MSVSLIRRIVLLSVWPCLIGTIALAIAGARSIVLAAVFSFPIVAYVLTLQYIEPWLLRRAANREILRAGGAEHE